MKFNFTVVATVINSYSFFLIHSITTTSFIQPQSMNFWFNPMVAKMGRCQPPGDFENLKLDSNYNLILFNPVVPKVIDVDFQKLGIDLEWIDGQISLATADHGTFIYFLNYAYF